MSRFTSAAVRCAVILSAGQGRRLRPLTDGLPKCALAIGGRTIIERQVDALLDAGIERIHPVLGYGADAVESLLARRYGAGRVEPVFNPFFEVADNLGSCWMARGAMTEDFVLLNGDTLFEPGVLARLLDAPPAPVTVAVDHKPAYDEDDMKVQLDGDRLQAVGKSLPLARADGESIGMLLLRGEGPALFAQALDDAMRDPMGLRQFYLWVIDSLARAGLVSACSIAGLRWAELDFPKDLPDMEALFHPERPLARTAAPGA